MQMLWTSCVGTHAERCGPEHVWLISVIPVKSGIGVENSTMVGSLGTGSVASTQTSLDLLQEEYLSEGHTSSRNAAVMLFRPSNTALQPDRFCHIFVVTMYA